MHWSFEGKYIACIIILILALYSRGARNSCGQQTLYYECLSASFCSIVINIAAIWLMGRPRISAVLTFVSVEHFVLCLMAAVEFLMAQYLLLIRLARISAAYYQAEKVSADF